MTYEPDSVFVEHASRMTRLEYLAAAAMNGLLSHGCFDVGDYVIAAEHAAQYALALSEEIDAMVAAHDTDEVKP